jgi:exosortase/archaeosortase family protein
MRRQIFPLAFCFLALPWPRLVEHPVTMGLLKIITSAVVVFLNLCGIAAAQQGNVIQLHLHELGMETACSGIESLQAALMAAVFLGELHFLRASRRWLLAGSAILLAMAMNFLRVSGLAILMEFSGPEAEARFHDPAGGIATAVLFLLLVFAAGAGAQKGMPMKTGGFSHVTCAPAWAGWCGFMAAFSVMTAGALAFGLSLPANDPAPILRNINPSRLPPGWTAHPDALTATEQIRLRHSQEERWHFRSPEGAEAYVIYLRWKDGTQTDATAYPHSPALCLPSQGWTKEEKIDDVRVDPGAGRESVPFNGYHFSQQSARLVALQCLSSGQTYLPPPSAGQGASEE